MSLFPDCRNDDYYNADFLDSEDTKFIQGFDYALNIICDLFCNNLSLFEKELSEVAEDGVVIPSGEVFSTRMDLPDVLKENAELICTMIENYHEAERNAIITQFIDYMDSDEYKSIRKKVLYNNDQLIASDKKIYYDTRK